MGKVLQREKELDNVPSATHLWNSFKLVFWLFSVRAISLEHLAKDKHGFALIHCFMYFSIAFVWIFSGIVSAFVIPILEKYMRHRVD
jgi:membrane protein YdbS with pleckstrin-like domain